MGTITPPDLPSRKSICFAQPEPNVVIHDGDTTFRKELGRLYGKDESILLEELVQLKAELKQTKTEDFWSLVTERMAAVLNAQFSFVSKRILVDEQDAAIEMPPIGEPGACLMASAVHFNDGKDIVSTVKAFKYQAYGCPCGYMRHDKIFVIPEKLNVFITDNPNELPFPCEAYIGVPLFADGKCFAHFGLMWSEDGAKRRKHSWPVIELFLHSLEDMILERLLEGSHFAEADVGSRDRNRIIPHGAVTAAQSLKPYARSLSHELRTPMQGVVGMLDVMYATVLEAAEGQTDEGVRQVFETLKENIEVVQDSSRRAVEAADNVVHAYDMDLHIPEMQPRMVRGDSLSEETLPVGQELPEILVAGHNLPIQRPNKRRREDDRSIGHTPSKLQASHATWASRGQPSEELKAGVHEAEELPASTTTTMTGLVVPSPQKSSERAIAPGLRHTQIRNVIQYVVNEGLKVGGRPESAIARETDTGEVIEVQRRTPVGDPRQTLIEWTVDPVVPTTMFVDERDLGKLVSCVFLNAIKFTEQGRITVNARMSQQSRHVVISIADTGPGIPATFLPRMFKPFSQEDPSLTRQSEGLGLGLLVAKGIARKLGGDLLCTRANTSEQNHGSTFEIRIPVMAGDRISRPGSPLGSPNLRTSARSDESLDRKEKTLTPPSDESLPLRPTANGDAIEQSRLAMPPPSSDYIRSDMAQFRSPIPHLAASPTPDDRPRRPVMLGRKSSATIADIDRNLANKYPLSFLVAEDNKINRKLLVSMLSKFGYKSIYEAYDGADAVRQMEKHQSIDVVLMDLWMPFMDGYEATEKILSMDFIDRETGRSGSTLFPTVLAVSADVTDGALERAAKVGMKGFMTKPFKLLDLQRLILEYCARSSNEGTEEP